MDTISVHSHTQPRARRMGRSIEMQLRKLTSPLLLSASVRCIRRYCRLPHSRNMECCHHTVKWSATPSVSDHSWSGIVISNQPSTFLFYNDHKPALCAHAISTARKSLTLEACGHPVSPCGLAFRPQHNLSEDCLFGWPKLSLRKRVVLQMYTLCVDRPRTGKAAGLDLG